MKARGWACCRAERHAAFVVIFADEAEIHDDIYAILGAGVEALKRRSGNSTLVEPLIATLGTLRAKEGGLLELMLFSDGLFADGTVNDLRRNGLIVSLMGRA